MKNQIKFKKVVYPWDIKGYIEISDKDRKLIINQLFSKVKNNKDISKLINVPKYWFYNFSKSKKIRSTVLKSISENVNLSEINIIKFNDDKGSSSIDFRGSFPIEYSPSWHFIFCLSIGDGYLRKGRKKSLSWYQKPEGLIKLVEKINSLGFDYKPSIKTCKQGIVIPQLIRKVGSYVTGLSNQEEINKNIFKFSAELGREYEIALLMAFFLDEAGMRTRNSSEITLHQEGNLKLLENFEQLLNKLNIKFSRNSKGNKWCIRFNNESVIGLNSLFNSLNKFNLSLLHRQEVFDKKVKIAKKNLYKLNLRSDAEEVKRIVLNKYKNKGISLSQIRKLYKYQYNVSTRSRKLVSSLKKQNKLEIISLGKYKIKSGKI
ncbi:MAG: hypothetical protein ABH824_01955 [Nanoarchaeota archaeon]|nr:hypothetical protein [Nanoarchaeota archaeon]MBU1632750.1 hypothetical protein [Nanoarchaeota archaeon]MBU1876001.1 hypothetical protein [Nanoarchaeota archaeon]